MLIKDLIPQYSNSNLEISAIEIDSRLVKKGAIFFALKGHNSDGTKFIQSAFENGAVAVVYDEKENYPDISLPLNSDERIIIAVEDIHQILGESLQKFYPNLPRNIFAVTGTNGKTSVAYFIQQLQEILGKKSASIGTIGIKTSEDDKDNTNSDLQELTPFTLTTPDIVSLYKNLSILKQRGIDDVTIEASSIGLDQHRLGGLKIGLAAFTNFTQDHLDYHGSMEKYFDSKMMLFSELLQPRSIAVLNGDVGECDKILKVAIKKDLIVFAYSAENDFPIHIKNIPLKGDFQKSNLLCALLSVVSYYQLNKEQIQFLIDNIDKIKPAEGRMQLVKTLENNSQIFIDYAHTPDALKNVLATAKKMPHNKLFVVFGCGGDRDKSKRPQMGKIASDLADFAIVTDDNPRGEDAAEIRKEILAACDSSKTIEVGNRKEAIGQAISKLAANDILIIAGKGHEKYQIIGQNKFEFDEEKIILNFIS